MKSLNSITIILFLVLFSLKLTAQNSETDSTSSNQLIEKGIGLFEEGKYDEAIKIYSLISECDPNYWWACYESALSYYSLDKLETALSKCHEAEDLNPDDVATISLIGSIMDDLGQTTEAISYLKNALTTKPYNQKLLYNIAVCYTKAGQLEKAEEELIRSIRINPYHKSSNLLLAKINFYMGRVAQSYLAYNMAILLNPRVSYINEFEKAISGKLDSLSHPYKYPYPIGVEHRKWDELTWLLNSEMAFNEEFDYDYKINYLTLRQSLMLFRKMNFDKSDTSFYNQFYVRFFSEVFNRNYFESYINYSFKNTDNKIVAQWLKENQDKLDEFIKWGQSAINSYRSYGFSTLNEDKKEKVRHYNDDGDLSSIGKQKTEPSEVRYGEWLTIHSDGWIQERGPYVDDNLEGEWFIYWPDGKVKQQLIFHDDKLDGIIKTYYPNGVKSGIFTYVKGEKDGIQEDYISSGKLYALSTYQDNKLNGKKTRYYFDDGFVRESFYTSGKTDGKITEKWLNGVLKSEVSAKDSLYEGISRDWFANSKLQSEGFYKADIPTGKWKNYNHDGSLNSEGEYDDKGNLTGKKTTYYRNGKVQSEESSYTEGVFTGSVTRYFENGAKQSIHTFNADKPVKIECFDTTGKSLYTAVAINGVLHSKTFYANGTLETEGDLKDGLRDGKWMIYDPLGRTTKELMYKSGLQYGPQKQYHENGGIQAEFNCDSNMIIGLYKLYYSSGQLEMSGYYDKNGRVGEWVAYFANDSVQSKSFYVDDERVGRQFFYTPTGKINTEEYFNDEGRSIRLKIYDQAGKMTQDQKFEYDSVEFKEYYPSGKLKTKKLIVNNVQHGTVETYFPNGKLHSQKTYIYGLANGVGKTWDYDGSLEMEFNYEMGKMDGPLKVYENGKLWYTDPYDYGESQGTYNRYYSNGRLASKTMYVDDRKHGNADFYEPDSSFMNRLVYLENFLVAYTYKDAKGNFLPLKPVTTETNEIVSYYPNGKISARTPLKNGLNNGKSISYYPSGKIMRESNFVKGDFEGAFKFYYENGVLKELINFHNDERNGQYELYFENGKKQKEGQFIAGQAQGEWHVYNETGKLVNTLYYDNDEIYDIK
jgi:uncharacterized protein